MKQPTSNDQLRHIAKFRAFAKLTILETEETKKMTCYHPLIRYETHEQYRCQDGHLAYKARVFKPDPTYKEEYESIEQYANSLLGKMHYRRVQVIPCGKCIGCRLEYSKDWATKGIFEAEMHDQNWFLTITYDDEHLPEADDMIGEHGEIICKNPNGTLRPADMVNFNKKIRDIYQRKHNIRGIRVMYCGEYGEKMQRPHYHGIYFGLPIYDMKFHEYNENHEALYRVPELEEIWGKGMVVAAEVNWNTCAYVARYITKKVGLPTQEEYYKRLGIEPEFFRTSRRPGIGREYFEKHKEEIYASDKLVIKKYGGGTMDVKPPRYYDKLYDIENHKEMEQIKKRRNANAERVNHLRDSQTTLHRKEQLQLTELSKKAQSKLLLRNKI